MVVYGGRGSSVLYFDRCGQGRVSRGGVRIILVIWRIRVDVDVIRMSVGDTGVGWIFVATGMR